MIKKILNVGYKINTRSAVLTACRKTFRMSQRRTSIMLLNIKYGFK